MPMSLISAWFRIPFWQRVVAGFVLGALVNYALARRLVFASTRSPAQALLPVSISHSSTPKP